MEAGKRQKRGLWLGDSYTLPPGEGEEMERNGQVSDLEEVKSVVTHTVREPQ